MYEICIYYLKVMFNKKSIGYNHSGKQNWKVLLKK